VPTRDYYFHRSDNEALVYANANRTTMHPRHRQAETPESRPLGLALLVVRLMACALAGLSRSQDAPDGPVVWRVLRCVRSHAVQKSNTRPDVQDAYYCVLHSQLLSVVIHDVIRIFAPSVPTYLQYWRPARASVDNGKTKLTQSSNVRCTRASNACSAASASAGRTLMAAASTCVPALAGSEATAETSMSMSCVVETEVPSVSVHP
jgi:hypothetical protein